MTGSGSYHHGDLRHAVLEAAVELIAEQGVGQLSLRELARRAGVSHAAPAHHFGDKSGLFTAIAAEGHELLANALTGEDGEAALPLDEQGVRYIQFAERHPAHFEVMFRPDLLHRDDPELVAARTRSGQALRGGVEALPAGRRGGDTEDAALAAWSLAHGFAELRRTGNLDPLLQGRDPADAFRAAASHLFGGSS